MLVTQDKKEMKQRSLNNFHGQKHVNYNIHNMI